MSLPMSLILLALMLSVTANHTTDFYSYLSNQNQIIRTRSDQCLYIFYWKKLLYVQQFIIAISKVSKFSSDRST